jgi:S1-C subfamily serine protease
VLIAHVIPGTPAALADIRNGDVLVSVDGRPAADWWNDPNATWNLPPGTKVELNLQRGNAVIHRTVIAQDILVARK